ncbi:MAG: hypothetical protein BGN96_01495 [Bacteroidales bacterium 45-6]|nr:MAG: hypothetical protein BGN96_01495 [Bacteroidales bacterium 45-6]
MEEKTKTAAVAPELNFDIALNEDAVAKLKTVAKWSNILVITYYVLIGISIIFSLFSFKIVEKLLYLTGQSMPPVPFGAYVTNILASFVFYGIVVVPFFFLQRFSKKAKRALVEKDERLVADAFADQSMFFKLFSWYAIVGAAIVCTVFIGLILVLFLVA